MHTEDFTISLDNYEFCQVPSYMPSSPLGVHKSLIIPNTTDDCCCMLYYSILLLYAA